MTIPRLNAQGEIHLNDESQPVSVVGGTVLRSTTIGVCFFRLYKFYGGKLKKEFLPSNKYGITD